MNASPTPKSAHSVIHKGLFTHHAYLIVGGQPEYENIHALIEKEFDINSAGNADFFDRSYGSFTIDDAREVKSAHSMKPLSHEALKIFILRMDAITTEAQNALLKLLEEPASYAKFFLILPSAHLLLLTVRSRLASASKTSSIHSKKR